MPLYIVEDAGDSTFEYVTVSGRVSTVTINQTAQSDTDLVALRVTTKYYYEIEYAN